MNDLNNFKEDVSFSHPLPEGHVCVTPSIDALDYCRSEHVDFDDSVFLRNDASLLFHMQDMESKYGSTVANGLARRAAGAASSLQNTIDNLSDNEILDTVVPRHIQSPSEIKMYSEHLNSLADNERSKFLEFDAAQKAAAEKAAAEKAAAESSLFSSSNSE